MDPQSDIGYLIASALGRQYLDFEEESYTSLWPIPTNCDNINALWKIDLERSTLAIG